MKKLYIIRHAKSSWPLGAPDFDRPLNERGKSDAPAMAKRLLKKGEEIELFVSSPAKRAITTCRFFAEAFDVKEKKIQQVDELYHASPDTFFQVIGKLDNKKDSAAVFSHNPGITEFVNKLTDLKLDNMPTCGIFAVDVMTDDWGEINTAEKKLRFFDYPKNS